MVSLDALKKLVQSLALEVGETKILASGQSSNVYVNCKRLTLESKPLSILSQVLWAKLAEIDPTVGAVAGVSVGGDPMVAGVLMSAAQEGRNLSGLLVRKEPKAHGATQGRAVEGLNAEQLSKSVWLLEDVISTGGSSEIALKHLMREGYSVSGLLCIIDREMGGVQAIRQKLGVRVEALFKLSEITPQ
jgi:orotate phosphoribosyltransferase